MNAHGTAADAAKEAAAVVAEADAAYKQFKDACELKRWDAALVALNRAVALDGKRFRPVPKHYVIEGILAAGAFGVVLGWRRAGRVRPPAPRPLGRRGPPGRSPPPGPRW